MGTHMLDVRRIATGEEQAATVLRDFDALQCGEAMVVLDGRAPREILHRLQTDRPGQFDWNPLETGPGRWRVEVVRRQTIATDNVTEFVEGDHHRLFDMFERICRLVAEERCADAASAFLEFRSASIRHLESEEKFLYPVFEQAAREAQPTAELRADHVTIRRLLDDFARAVDLRHVDLCRATAEKMTALFSAHWEKERPISTTVDRAVGDDNARRHIISTMQGV